MQDKAFVQIGKIALEQLGNKEPYELFIQNMFPDKSNYNMILPCFEVTRQEGEYKCAYKNVDIENVNKDNFLKYAYRKGSARGGDITFTTKFGDIEKKFRTLVDNQFKTLIGSLANKASEEFDIFHSVYKLLRNKEDYEKIKNDLVALHTNLSKEEKTTSGLSIMIIVDGTNKYLADFDIIRQLLLSSGTEEKSEKYGVTSTGINAVCSICLQKRDKVHGFASPLKYATVDKPGMVSGFFKQANNWKNYPICTDCSLEFELGRTYITNNFSSYFYGKAYYIIPKTLLSDDIESLKKATTKLKGLYNDVSKIGMIRAKEDLLEKHMADDEDYYNVNLLFYEENPTTKAIKIKLLLEEILPSRFRKLFVDAPGKINGHPLYQNATTVKKEKANLSFNFGILKTFFDDDFYDLIYRVFTLQQFSKEILYSRFMSVIRSNYNKMQASDSGYVEMTRTTLLKAHLTLAYFKELNIIEYKQSKPLMDTIDITEKKSSFDIVKLKHFVTENAGFLDSDYKIGIFSIGILVRLLLNVQQANLGNTPFEKKLKGYNLNPSLIKNIYIETLSKISQYQNFYSYGNLREFIDEFFTRNIDKINKVSNNELSFYFVAGIEFGGQFKNKDNQDSDTTSKN